MNYQCAISVDWLQVYCLSTTKSPIPTQGELSNEKYKFSFRLTDNQTAMFSDLIEVTMRGLECAVIEQRPRSPKLKKEMVLIKLSNRMLYSNRYIDILYSLMSVLNVTYKGITRLDLCYDCIYFADGRKPDRFINNFVMKPDNEIGGIARKGSDEFIVHGKKAAGSSSKINYISFGSPKSRIRTYIYDKTLELTEVKDKPWIREMWKENNLIPKDNEHIFRSEISIKSEGMDVLNMSTGELFRLSPIYLENQISIEKLFHYYANKYLSFSINEGQKLRKNYRKLEIYAKKSEITCKPIHINMSHDTGRMEKIVYNKLEKLSETYTDLSEPRRAAIQSAMEFIKELEGIKSQTLANERYKAYLNELKGRMFYDQHIIDYIDAIRAAHEEKESLRNNYAYFLYESKYATEMNAQPELMPI